MIYILLNAVPILAATLAGMILGAVYLRVTGQAVDRHRHPSFLATTFIAQAWFAAILAGALILAPPKAEEWTMALGTAIVIWIGFVVPVLVVTLRARGMGWRDTALDCAHWLALMLLQAFVLKSIGLVPPPS